MASDQKSYYARIPGANFHFLKNLSDPYWIAPSVKQKRLEIPAYSSHETNYVGHTFAFSFTLFILRAGLSNLPPGKNWGIH